MQKTRIVIVSPALHDANNGNWQTARRWQQLLAPTYAVRIVGEWPDAQASGADRAMLALHALRSAQSIRAWAGGRDREAPGLAVVLTGTDLYRDILEDRDAQASLRLAQQLVTLQECGPDALPPGLRSKACVIYQSTTPRQFLPKTARHLRVVVVGHLRPEKAPGTVFELARLLRPHADILIDHVGAALEPALGRLAAQTARACPAYRWIGAQPHEATRRRIQRAHVLLHPSRMEGGAHVVMEAVRSGTAVVASRVSGNIGMLGRDYAGYFDPGDAAGAAKLLLQCRYGPSGSGSDMLGRLMLQCQARAPLFDAASERVQLIRLVGELVASHAPGT